MNKKTFFLIAVILTLCISCTDNSTEILEERREINEDFNKIDPIKDCPQNDRNCNGVPDSEE